VILTVNIIASIVNHAKDPFFYFDSRLDSAMLFGGRVRWW